jgi:hypothetical protein
MNRDCLFLFVMIVPMLGAGAPSAADDSGPQNGLVGTWRLVSAKYDGNVFEMPEGTTTLKHVTPQQFMWASYDNDGTVTRAAGGGYTLKGETYEERPEYGISDDFDLIKGKPQTFTWRLEGNKWHHTGKLSNGLTIEEVWERVGPK